VGSARRPSDIDGQAAGVGINGALAVLPAFTGKVHQGHAQIAVDQRPVRVTGYGAPRENNRLIVRTNAAIHDGAQTGTEGVVIAPETMEASVASVDWHDLSRIIAPAAAASVQRLGQAPATTSNTDGLHANSTIPGLDRNARRIGLVRGIFR